MLGLNARIVAQQFAPEAVTAGFDKLLHILVWEHGHDPVVAAAWPGRLAGTRSAPEPIGRR